MESYSTRSVRFFFKSIRTLKKESGGQRWNEICEDAASLFEHLYIKQVAPLHLDHQQLWDILFDPPQETNDKFIDFFMIILQALLDPPPS